MGASISFDRNGQPHFQVPQRDDTFNTADMHPPSRSRPLSDLRREALALARKGVIVSPSATNAKNEMARSLCLSPFGGGAAAPSDSSAPGSAVPPAAAGCQLPDNAENLLDDAQLQAAASLLPSTALNLAAYRLCMRSWRTPNSSKKIVVVGSPAAGGRGGSNTGSIDGTGGAVVGVGDDDDSYDDSDGNNDDDWDEDEEDDVAPSRAGGGGVGGFFKEEDILPFRFASSRVTGVPAELAPPRSPSARMRGSSFNASSGGGSGTTGSGGGRYRVDDGDEEYVDEEAPRRGRRPGPITSPGSGSAGGMGSAGKKDKPKNKKRRVVTMTPGQVRGRNCGSVCGGVIRFGGGGQWMTMVYECRRLVLTQGEYQSTVVGVVFCSSCYCRFRFSRRTLIVDSCVFVRVFFRSMHC